jgi:signal peptidase I
MKYLVALILIMLGACTPAIIREQQEDINLQQEAIKALQQENAVLREVNDRLREHVISCSTNLSLQEEILQVCKENYAPLQNRTWSKPSVRIPLNDVLVSEQQVIITVPDLQEGIIAASKSMEPFLSEDDIVIERPPSSSADIQIDDIIIFEAENQRIIHRVIAIGHDDEGWYARTKGDNNLRADPWKVRFGQVKGVVVGIIY